MMAALSLVNLLEWSLQVALIVAGAAIAARLLPIDAAGVRHAWWRAGLVVWLALPLLQPWHLPALDGAAPLEAGSVPSPSSNVVTVHPERRVAVPLRALDGRARGLVSTVIATGAALRLAWLAAGIVRLRRLRRLGRRVPLGAMGAGLETLAPHDTEIRIVSSIGQPVTFGFRRPVVVLPDALGELPAAVQRAVLAHELWHVKRRDWIHLVIEESIRAVLWFHPAIWWLISRVQASREEVVDQLTVLFTSSRRDYLEALLAFCDRPSTLAAAPFARRRHLYQRMLLLSREAVMSSKRIVLSCAGMAIVLAVAGWYGVAAFPLERPAAGAAQAPPRDPRPSDVRPASARETALVQMVAARTATIDATIELATLQSERGALAAAEATLIALRDAQPASPRVHQALVLHYTRTGQFDRAVATLEDLARRTPNDPAGYQILAT